MDDPRKKPKPLDAGRRDEEGVRLCMKCRRNFRISWKGNRRCKRCEAELQKNPLGKIEQNSPFGWIRNPESIDEPVI